MSGIFVKWQPRYAEHGVPTFPVDIIGKDKKPSVKGYLSTSLGASKHFAHKFPTAGAFGFPCGKRSDITVLDIDSKDKRLVEEAAHRYGRSPILYRTLSGNHGMLFRYNGESRRIRAEHDLPIDILGDGGYAVAPPSIAATGRYEFLEGSLADLRCLPVLRLPANENRPQGRIPVGARNRELFRTAMIAAQQVDDSEALLDVLRTRNEFDCDASLPYAEVVRIAKSAWNYQRTGKNFVGKGLVTQLPTNVIKQLYLDKQHAPMVLLMTLKAYHLQDERFVVARAMAKNLGWHPRKFYAARDKLEQLGLIECVHRGGQGPTDPPIYRSALRCSTCNTNTN